MTRIFLKPWVAAAGLAVAAALVVLNFAAAAFGADKPWLAALDLVSDLAVLGAMVFIVVQTALSSEANSARARAALDESNARLTAIVDSAMDAVITVDQEQNIILFNRAAEQLFGLRQDQAVGTPLERLLPVRYRGAHHGHMAHFGNTG